LHSRDRQRTNPCALCAVYTGIDPSGSRKETQMSRLALAPIVVVALSAASPCAAQSQSAPTNPGNLARFSRALKDRFDSITRDIVEAAEVVPPGDYKFRPTPEVRSFGELIGHIADSQNFFCGVAGGSNPEYSDAAEKAAPSTKAALVDMLKISVAKCGEVYAATNADNALDLVKAGKGDALRGLMLIDNISHDNEHYGNIVTYMRLKGRVPPSTARKSTQQAPGGWH
jgi:uncharacterized damage-inducible protein DinB